MLVCKHNAKPAGSAAGEGLTTAQYHLVSEEAPPHEQLLLKRRFSKVLPTRTGHSQSMEPLTLAQQAVVGWSNLPEISPDVQCSRPVQVSDAHRLQLSGQVAVSGFQSASVLGQELLTDPF